MFLFFKILKYTKQGWINNLWIFIYYKINDKNWYFYQFKTLAYILLIT